MKTDVFIGNDQTKFQQTTRHGINTLKFFFSAILILFSFSMFAGNDAGVPLNSNQLAIYENNIFVTGGDNFLASSTNGTSWNVASNGLICYSIAYGNGTFVAVGYENQFSAPTTPGAISYSTDGVNWSSVQLSTSTLPLYTVAYGNGTFVTAGEGGDIYYSTNNGQNWAESSNRFNTAINNMAYGNGTFVGVCNDETIIYSQDGINWSVAPGLSGKADINAVIFANGVFIASAGYETILYSSNGINWSIGQGLSGDSDLVAVAYGNGTFVTVGTDGTIVTSTDNGANWNNANISLPASDDFEDVTYGNGMFVATGKDIIYTSSDGINWTLSQTSLQNYDTASTPTGTSYAYPPTPIAYGNGTFILSYYNGNSCTIMYSTGNGSTWDDASL